MLDKEVNMVKIGVTPTYSVIEEATPEELESIKESLSHKDPLFQIKRRFNKFVKPEMSFLKRDKFPTGLLMDVINKLEDDKYKYQVSLKYRYPYPTYNQNKLNFKSMGMEKRQYQVDAAKVAIDERRGCIQVATGGGKTDIAIIISRCFPNVDILYLVHTKELLHQTRRRFQKSLGEEVGIIGDGKTDIKRITVATVQTLRNYFNKDKGGEWMLDIKILFIDECHHTSSDSFYNLCMEIPAPYRFGLSATPLTGKEIKDLRLKAITGEILYVKDTEELKDEGYLSDADVRMIEVPICTNPEYGHKVCLDELYPRCIPPKEKDYKKPDGKLDQAAYDEAMRNHYAKVRNQYKNVYHKGVVENRYRNMIIADIINNNKNKKVLVLCERIEHSNTIFSYLDINLDVMVMNGSSDGILRDEAMKDLNEGRLNCIIATIFREGADIPNVDMIVVAGGLKSTIITKQRIGRGLRLKKKGGKLQIIDFMDTSHFFLEKHSNMRMDTMKKDGFDVKIERGNKYGGKSDN
jgi:superfamily II DNA or RNA helicase